MNPPQTHWQGSWNKFSSLTMSRGQNSWSEVVNKLDLLDLLDSCGPAASRRGKTNRCSASACWKIQSGKENVTAGNPRTEVERRSSDIRTGPCSSRHKPVQFKFTLLVLFLYWTGSSLETLLLFKLQTRDQQRAGRPGRVVLPEAFTPSDSTEAFKPAHFII